MSPLIFNETLDKFKSGELNIEDWNFCSMTGKIESGQLCTVKPIKDDDLNIGDIVLCKVAGKQYLHLIKAINGNRFQIGNNKGHINGWIGRNCIFGNLVKVE